MNREIEVGRNIASSKFDGATCVSGLSHEALRHEERQEDSMASFRLLTVYFLRVSEVTQHEYMWKQSDKHEYVWKQSQKSELIKNNRMQS